MTQAISELDSGTMLSLVTNGDCSKLTPKQQLQYYQARCEAAGIDARTQPFQFLKLGGKVVLYALKGATDQLASKHGIVCEILSQQTEQGIRTVTVRATTKDGRQTDEIGCVPVSHIKKPDDLANAFMKAVTKAKRRAVISICGLGVIDESELDTVSDRVQPVQPVIQKPQPKRVKPKAKPKRVDPKDHLTEGMFEAEIDALEQDENGELIDDYDELHETLPIHNEPEHLADIPGVKPVALESGGDFVDQQDGFVTVTVKRIGPLKEGQSDKGPWTKWGFLFVNVATGEEIGWANTFSETISNTCTNAKHKESAIQIKLSKKNQYGRDILEAVGDDE